MYYISNAPRSLLTSHTNTYPHAPTNRHTHNPISTTPTTAKHLAAATHAESTLILLVPNRIAPPVPLARRRVQEPLHAFRARLVGTQAEVPLVNKPLLVDTLCLL